MENNSNIFNSKYINYLGSGCLGDFINQLSIINENYLNTGRKGNLYITDKYEIFRFGLNHTYNDIYEVIKSQIYINDFKLYNGENIDINLSNWRHNELLYKTNTYHLLRNHYNMEWGKNKWLDVENDKKWNNKVIVNMTQYRYNDSFDFTNIQNDYNGNIIFMANNYDDYLFFKSKHNINIDYYKPLSFKDMCIVINSCKLFIGGLSAPLVIANALFKKTIILLCDNNDLKIDNIHIQEFDKIYDFISFF